MLSAPGVAVGENADAVAGEIAAAADNDDDDDDKVGDLPLSEWVGNIGCDVLGHYDYDTHAIIDDDTVTTQAQTDEDLVTEMRNKNRKLDLEGRGGDKEEEVERQETEEKQVHIPTASEAIEAIRIVNRFYESRARKSKIVTKFGH
jgi:hypothetical protein